MGYYIFVRGQGIKYCKHPALDLCRPDKAGLAAILKLGIYDDLMTGEYKRAVLYPRKRNVSKDVQSYTWDVEYVTHDGKYSVTCRYYVDNIFGKSRTVLKDNRPDTYRLTGQNMRGPDPLTSGMRHVAKRNARTSERRRDARHARKVDKALGKNIFK